MRTAICFTGQPRSIKQTWKTYHEFLHNNLPNPDVFIYTSEEYNCPEFFDVIKPVSYLVEGQFPHDNMESFLKEAGFYADHMINSTIQQFYGWKKVLEMKMDYELKNNFKYDLVVK